MTTLRAWLVERPFGLAMSSGFFGFFAHTGMLAALTADGHRPAHVAGSSAGALVGGAWAAGVEPDALGAVLRGLSRDAFWDPRLGAGLLAGQKFDAILRRILPTHALEACRVPTRISVFDIAARRTEIMERGDLVDAIRASCCVPVMFHPVRIGGRAYWDGGILDRPGIAGVPVGERLLFHHLASKSPWRASLPIPRRAGMVTLVIEDLPRSGPWQLPAGRQALELARAATARALDTAIGDDGIVRVAA
ncbi:MAG: patatin-like phospholipase family protein [Proteobacteria bacterium]|nr:patatin-like phospholipase family protein [Pseudomonadota bacterium]